MNKIIKSFIVIITILFLLLSMCPLSLAETDFAEQIDSEEGSMFEKIIAGMLGGIAQAILTCVLQKQWVLDLKIMMN